MQEWAVCWQLMRVWVEWERSQRLKHRDNSIAHLGPSVSPVGPASFSFLIHTAPWEGQNSLYGPAQQRRDAPSEGSVLLCSSQLQMSPWGRAGLGSWAPPDSGGRWRREQEGGGQWFRFNGRRPSVPSHPHSGLLTSCVRFSKSLNP